jgi:hypothetical protein
VKVTHGSCNDSFSISTTAQDKLLATPPAPLTEIYYECTMGSINALTTSLGIAMGNVILLRFACILLVGLIVHVYITRKRAKPIEYMQTYSTQERQRVMDYLAFTLLLARDGLYTGGSSSGGASGLGSGGGGVGGGNIVRELQRELAASGTVKRFFDMSVMSEEEEEYVGEGEVELKNCGAERSGLGEGERESGGSRADEYREELTPTPSSSYSTTRKQVSNTGGSRSRRNRSADIIYHAETVPNPLALTKRSTATTNTTDNKSGPKSSFKGMSGDQAA